jgi:hypothetical protein
MLAEHGWTVVRVWEHEDPASSARRVAEAIHIIRSDTLQARNKRDPRPQWEE